MALDFTPNSNHAGFYCARARGYYSEAGLEVALLSPHVDGYNATPGSRVADGSATFASCPSETLIRCMFTRKAQGAEGAVGGMQPRSSSCAAR